MSVLLYTDEEAGKGLIVVIRNPKHLDIHPRRFGLLQLFFGVPRWICTCIVNLLLIHR
jgi:hypothetical protein